MIIIGVDPGSLKTGYGILSVEGATFRPVDYGVIRTRAQDDMPRRLKTIYEKLSILCQDFKPAEGAVESVFHGRNAVNYDSTLKLGQARGVALVALCNSGIEISEYTPADVKKSIAGHGRAEKWQIQKMIETLLRLDAPAAEDASDALAVALCHAFRRCSFQTLRRG